MSACLPYDPLNVPTHPSNPSLNAVDRLVAKSNLFEMDLLLDINSEVYPIKQGEEIALMLTKYVGGWLSTTALIDGARPGSIGIKMQ